MASADRAAGVKATPNLSSVRQTTRQQRRVRPCSKVRSNVSGKPNVLASLRHAPAPVMFFTVQKITGERRGTMIFALRETRVRLSRLRSTCLIVRHCLGASRGLPEAKRAKRTPPPTRILGKAYRWPNANAEMTLTRRNLVPPGATPEFAVSSGLVVVRPCGYRR
jgi:hypothetical protein